MEKKVLLKDLVDSGTSLRKQITSKVRVSDQGAYPIGEIWDANTTINTIVDGASIAFDTLKEVEQKLNELDADLTAEINRAKAAELAEENRAKAAENNLNNIKADKTSVYTKQETYNRDEISALLGELKVVDQYAIYTYNSFNQDGSVEYSSGKAQLTGVVSGEYTQIVVIEDQNAEFVGQKFFILSNAIADGQTLNQLYNDDKEQVGLAVKTLLYSETTYKSASVKEYVDFVISQHGGGQLGPDSVSSLDIQDGTIQMVDLSDEVKNKL